MWLLDLEKEIVISKILERYTTERKEKVQLQEIAEQLNISRKRVRAVVSWLISKGVQISFSGDDEISFHFSHNFFDFFISLYKLGYSLTKIVRCLSWSDFESYISDTLQKLDFQTYVNFRTTINKRRREIDIIAVKDNTVLCIDAKHWNKSISKSRLLEIVRKQKERCTLLASSPYKLLKFFPDLTYYSEIYLVPIIVVLHKSKTNFIDRVYVIPWISLNEFLLTFEVTDKNMWKASVETKKLKLL